MALQALLFGLVAALTWGLGDFYGAKTSKRFGGISAGFFISFGTLLLYGLVYVLCFREYTQIDARAIWFAVGGGSIFTLGAVSFFKALELGPVSIVSPLGALIRWLQQLF